MNKQEAYEIAKQAELNSALSRIEAAAKRGDYHIRFVIENTEVVDELNKLGFNCGRVEDFNMTWNIDWSK